MFRDEATIKYGEDFPSEIERAVISSDVVLVLIGRKWLTVRGKDGRRRLDAPGDYVRKEIETALSQGLDVIPVLVDGAVIPSSRELPRSIIPLLTRNACKLHWHEEVAKLEVQLRNIAQKRTEKKAAEAAEQARIDLIDRSGKRIGNVVIRAMETSLEARAKRDELLGLPYKAPAHLDEKDLHREVKRVTGRSLEMGVPFHEMIYVIDHVGIKAMGHKSARYCARSFPVRSLQAAREELKLGHPILAGVSVHEFWFGKEVSKKGIIDYQETPGPLQGGTFIALVRYDPVSSMFGFMTAWPTWGDGGFGWLTERAAEAYLDKDLRALDAAPGMVQLPWNLQVVEEQRREQARAKKS